MRRAPGPLPRGPDAPAAHRSRADPRVLAPRLGLRPPACDAGRSRARVGLRPGGRAREPPEYCKPRGIPGRVEPRDPHRAPDSRTTAQSLATHAPDQPDELHLHPAFGKRDSGARSRRSGRVPHRRRARPLRQLRPGWRHDLLHNRGSALAGHLSAELPRARPGCRAPHVGAPGRNRPPARPGPRRCALHPQPAQQSRAEPARKPRRARRGPAVPLIL